MSVRFFAPAKLNLSLDLGPARADGYHEIRSVMQAVSLGDRLHVVPAARFRVENPQVPAGDLVTQAAEIFEATTGIRAAVSVRVQKRIPIGAGLGGGSSDAACILRALRDILLPELPADRLLAMARQIGSDVPFFLGGAPRALAVGRGEILTPLPPAPPRFAVIAWPGVGLRTQEVYRVSSPGPGNATEAVLAGAEQAANDLAPAALRLCPALKELVFQAAAKGVRLQVTGSGSAAFSLHADSQSAACALQALRPLAPRVLLCQTLDAWPWRAQSPDRLSGRRPTRGGSLA